MVHAVRIILKDIGMEFEIDKCNTARIRKGKIYYAKDMEIPDRQWMRQNKESDYKYLGIIQDSEIKTL